jgi:hypothetical protein
MFFYSSIVSLQAFSTIWAVMTTQLERFEPIKMDVLAHSKSSRGFPDQSNFRTLLHFGTGRPPLSRQPTYTRRSAHAPAHPLGGKSAIDSMEQLALLVRTNREVSGRDVFALADSHRREKA